MLEFQNISKSFVDFSGQKISVLKPLSISFSPSEFTLIIGPNGSGKSTILNLIAGSLSPDEGHILIDGKEVQKLKAYQRSAQVARIFQNPLQGTVSDLTVMENMRLAYLRNHSKTLKFGITKSFRDMVKQHIAELKLGLENKTEQKMGVLSGGQRQVLTLVMATLSRAQVLLMDEPTAALDPKSSQMLMDNASEIIAKKNLIALMVTHNMHEAAHYGNRLLILKNGVIEDDMSSHRKSQIDVTALFNYQNQDPLFRNSKVS